MMEAVQAWPAASRRRPTLELGAFLTVRIKQAMVRLLIEHSRAVFIPEAPLRLARKPHKHGTMSIETRAKLLEGGRARPLRAALIRRGIRCGVLGAPMLHARQRDQSSERLGQRARLRAGIIEAASRYSGPRGDAADLLIAERIPVASKAHRTTHQSIADRTGLSYNQVRALESGILRKARLSMAALRLLKSAGEVGRWNL